MKQKFPRAQALEVAREPLCILIGDALQMLRTLETESVQCCVTSPPYWGLRDYGVCGQIGLEDTVEEFIGKLVEVFREVRRVLKNDGTCWVNMGDCYAGGGNGGGGIKAKDLVGQPWMLAFALRTDGWYLRRDIIWHKPTAMPESVKDRPPTAHEYLFLLTKSSKYHYDSAAISEPVSGGAQPRGKGVNPKCAGWVYGEKPHSSLSHSRPGGSYKGSVPGRVDGPGQGRRSSKPRQNASFSGAVAGLVERRNKRSVWTIPSEPFKEAHFATFPTALVSPCILAGSRPGDTVLDPFGGSGTTGKVALDLGRKAVLIELNPEYAKIAQWRTDVTKGFAFAV